MLPDDMLGMIRQSPRDGLCMSVITSSDGFVRLGLLCPLPDRVRVTSSSLLSPHPSSFFFLSILALCLLLFLSSYSNLLQAVVDQLCVIGGGNPDQLQQFEQALGVDGPAYAEYQYLMKGFGYGVYKEGFDVVFHYDVRASSSSSPSSSSSSSHSSRSAKRALSNNSIPPHSESPQQCNVTEDSSFSIFLDPLKTMSNLVPGHLTESNP